MTQSRDRKTIAKDKMHIAIENFMQAELEGAEKLAPVTYRWAKVKIYEDRKKILNPKSNEQMLEEAADDASAASAQLLSSVRGRALHNEIDLPVKVDLIEKEAITNLINEGGPVT